MSQKTARKGEVREVSFRLIDRLGPPVADSIKSLNAYEPVSSLPLIMAEPEKEHFKLDWNEATIPPSPNVKKEVMRYLDGQLGLNFYPQLFSPDLRLRLQSHVGYPTDHILVTNGSDDALDLICKTYLNPGDRILSPYPTYTHALLFAKSRGAVVDKVIFDDPYEHNLQEIVDHVCDDTKIIYLVNPNNPTGQMFNSDELVEIIEAAPHALLLIDEAYCEFARHSVVDLVGRFENVIITRTFSKVYGLAALRVGYMVAQPSAIKNMSRLYNPKSVNQVAQVAAIAALDDPDYYEKYIDEVNASKDLLTLWCQRNNIDVTNTPASYVMIKVDRVKEVVAGLADEGVYVRDRSSFPSLAGCFRLNLGTVEQTKEVIRRFETVLKSLELI